MGAVTQTVRPKQVFGERVKRGFNAAFTSGATKVVEGMKMEWRGVETTFVTKSELDDETKIQLVRDIDRVTFKSQKDQE